MAGREASESDIVYDPVRLHPTASLYNRIDLENVMDKDYDYRHGNNPNTRRPFDIYDIKPQTELRSLMRNRAVCNDEYFPCTNVLLPRAVIQDYPVEILGESQMSEYVKSLAQGIATVISLPRDSKALWQNLNFLRLNCQCSDSNKGLFRIVNGFLTLIEALSHHFCVDGLRGRTRVNTYNEDTVNICREIVKLAEITGFSAEDAPFITGSQSCAEGFCGILRIVYFHGHCNKDKRRILRITHSMFNSPRLGHLDNFFYVVDFMLSDSSIPSLDVILGADIADAYCSEGFRRTAVVALYKTLKTLVTRYYDSIPTNRIRVRVNEEFSDRSAALDKVLKILCRLCAEYGAEVVAIVKKPGENPLLNHANPILRYALLHPDAREAFSGRHLLFALLLNKFIFESSAGEGASPEDVKILFDFAMSDLPNRYLFNGSRKLRDLADQVVDNLLNCKASDNVLRFWTDFPLDGNFLD